MSPVIPILPSDSRTAVEYKVYLAGQVELLQTEHADLTKWRDYYRGQHTLLLSDDQKAFLEGVIDVDSEDWPLDNKVRKVVDKVKARLNVIGWQDGTGARQELADVEDPSRRSGQVLGTLGTTPIERATSWWVENDMDRWEGELYRAALRDEEAYVIVHHDGELPRFTVAYRWDGTTGIRMRYEDDAHTRPLYAIKYWRTLAPTNLDTSNVLRATIFTASAVYKYAQLVSQKQQQFFKVVPGSRPDEAGWYPIQDPGDTAWPIPWVDSRGQPLGLAVVPFISPRGSLIQNVIGLNNALNKTNLDLMAVADQQGFGLVVVKYAQLPTQPAADDASGDGLGLRPGSTLETTGDVTKLAADDLAGLLNYARHLTTSIASNSDIPLHEFIPTQGEVPSGAALQMLDSALANQADECCTWFTGSWRRVMSLAQSLALTYGGLQGEAARLSPVWASTAYVDPSSEEANRTAQAARVKTLVDAGMPLEIALREEGWDDAKIAELTKVKEAEAAAAQTSLAAALVAQQRAFDQGQQGGSIPREMPAAGGNGRAG